MVPAMLSRVAAGSGALALVLLLVVPPAPPVALAATRTCTGWTSEYAAPPTIRVYRTVGPARGTVQVVSFQRYVSDVLAAEFGSAAPNAALQAGAIAVKEYGWYYAIVWRGHRAPKGAGCYDVTDDSWDQVYWPEREHPSSRDLQAVRDTWTITVRKDGNFLPTGYRPGRPGTACGADADGWRLYQASTYRCAQDGMLYEQILRTYYGPQFEIVVPGIPNPGEDGKGEIGVAVPGAGLASGAPTPAPAPPSPAVALPSPSPTLPTGSSASPASAAASPASAAVPSPVAGFYDLVRDQSSEAPWQPPAVPAGTSLDPATSLGLAFAKVNHDGRADVLRLERLGTGGYRITVAPSEGGGSFAPAQTWWSSIGTGPDIDPGAAVRLVAGDFQGDGLDEAGILEGAPGTPPVVTPDGTTVTPAVVPEARLYLLDSTGSAFSAPRLAWSGSLDVSRAQAFAADVTGDGRADLVIASDLFPVELPNPPAGPPAVAPDGAELPVGIRVLVAPALQTGTLGPLQGWADVTDTTQAQSQVAVEDVNRDGMSDVVILRATGASGSELVGLISSGTRFSRVSMWTSASFQESASKIAAADLNGDGRGDLVVLYDAGSAGTRLYEFISTGSSFRPGVRVLDPSLVWSDVQPF